MGKTGFSRRGAAQPATYGSTRRPRGDGRLDPVRWRRPGRGTLLRLAAVAALLATAAAVLWSPPKQGCDAVNPAAARAEGTKGKQATTGRTSQGDKAARATSEAAGASSAGGSASSAGGSANSGGDSASLGGDSASLGGDSANSGGGSGADPSTSDGVPEGSVGVPIRLADPTALGLVRPGNRVDLLKLDDSNGNPAKVADSALVLRVTNATDIATGGLLLALTPEQASQAVATSRKGFAIVIRPD
jgi:hypothetical protein